MLPGMVPHRGLKQTNTQLCVIIIIVKNIMKFIRFMSTSKAVHKFSSCISLFSAA